MQTTKLRVNLLLQYYFGAANRGGEGLKGNESQRQPKLTAFLIDSSLRQPRSDVANAFAEKLKVVQIGVWVKGTGAGVPAQ